MQLFVARLQDRIYKTYHLALFLTTGLVIFRMHSDNEEGTYCGKQAEIFSKGPVILFCQ